MVLIGLGAIFLLFGAIASVKLVMDVRSGIAATQWPTAEGVILRAERSRSRSRLRSLEYRYSVAEQEYVGTLAEFIRVPYGRPIHSIYSSGQNVPVYYDPASPDRAVLEPGAPPLGLAAELTIPLIMLTIGAYLLRHALTTK